MIQIIKDVQCALGTFVTIAVIHPDISEGISALRAAFDEVHRIHRLMNAHQQNSEVGTLNREGYYEDASEDTRHVIRMANAFSEWVEGTFDITVLPLLKLWEEKVSEDKIPTDAEISEKLELVNYRDVLIENKKVSFRKNGMGITLAGVAKGYAVDKAVEALVQRNIKHALVNAGGDIKVIGGKREGIPWKIGIRDPRNLTQIVATVELHDQAIATSGIYRRSFNDIINPKAGRPAQGVLSSTVIAEKAMDADMLATCMYVLEARDGLDLIGKREGVKAFVIKSDGSVVD
ncbi:MAG TPA: FAD:protein FMN transferase [Thermodesulfobacteriota bacterium]|nr:FAD:protein FMN transferase [Thermodesulfobacteriota bacterium]